MGRPFFGPTLETTIDRSGYGITWQNPLPNGQPSLADDVTITAELFLTQEQADKQ